MYQQDYRKNEFVFTADAVRNAGGGDIDAGAEVMENMMNHEQTNFRRVMDAKKFRTRR